MKKKFEFQNIGTFERRNDISGSFVKREAFARDKKEIDKKRVEAEYGINKYKSELKEKRIANVNKGAREVSRLGSAISKGAQSFGKPKKIKKSYKSEGLRF